MVRTPLNECARVPPARVGRLGWVGLALVVACGGKAAPTLRVDSVEPPRIPFGVESEVIVHGIFEPRLAVDLSQQGQTTLVDDFEVEVGGIPAKVVKRLQTDRLDVVLPKELPVGTQPVTVTDPRGQRVTLDAAVEVFAPAPTRVAFVTSMRAAETGTWTEPIRIGLLDSAGQLTVSPQPVRLQVTSDSPTGRLARAGSLGPGTPSLDLTLPQGVQSVDFAFLDSAPGYRTLTAVADGFEPITQPVVVGRLGDASLVRFVAAPTPSMTAGATAPVVVEIQDVTGAPAGLPSNGIRVEVTAPAPLSVGTSPSGPFLPTQAAIIQSGAGRETFYLQGTQVAAGVEVKATATNLATGGPLGPDAVTVGVAPGPLAGFEVLRANTGDAVAGTPQRFAVRAVDQFGNTVTSWADRATLHAEPDGFSLSTPIASGGVFQQDVLLTHAGQGSVTVSDQASPPHTGQSAPFRVAPGPFAGFDVAMPAGAQVAGSPFPVTVRAVDAYGNTVPETHQVALAASGTPAGALSPTSSGPFTGAAQLAVTLTKALPNTALTVSEGAVARTSGSFPVLPGPIQRFDVSNAASLQTAGVPFAVTLRALDAYGNETLDAHDVALLASGVADGALSPVRSGTFVGHVNLQVAVTEAASGIRLAAQDASASGAQTAPFDVQPGPVAGFTLSAPPCVVNGTAFTLALQAVDAYGNPSTAFTGVVLLSSQVGFSPSKSPNFSAGALTLRNAKFANVGPTARTLTLVAVDQANAQHTGSTDILVKPLSCP